MIRSSLFVWDKCTHTDGSGTIRGGIYSQLGRHIAPRKSYTTLSSQCMQGPPSLEIACFILQLIMIFQMMHIEKFTPLLYQATEIVKICTQHSGLGLIFDEVRSSWQFLFIICSWCSCAPLGCPSWLLLQFVCKVTAGFNNKPVFINFTSAMVTLAECHDWGHDLQGMQSIPSCIQWVVPWTLLYFPCGIPQLPHKLWRQDGVIFGVLFICDCTISKLSFLFW